MSYSLFSSLPSPLLRLSVHSLSSQLPRLSFHLFILLLQSGCGPARHRTPICLRPIWKEFAHPLKCMFSATFIPFLLCFFFSLSLAVPCEQPATSLLASVKTVFSGADFVEDKNKNVWKPPAAIHTDKTNIVLVLLGAALPATMIPLCCNGPGSIRFPVYFNKVSHMLWSLCNESDDLR